MFLRFLPRVLLRRAPAKHTFDCVCLRHKTNVRSLTPGGETDRPWSS